MPRLRTSWRATSSAGAMVRYLPYIGRAPMHTYRDMGFVEELFADEQSARKRFRLLRQLRCAEMIEVTVKDPARPIAGRKVIEWRDVT